jgi:hypothetical protein
MAYFAGRYVERPVPGNDEPDHADRLLERIAMKFRRFPGYPSGHSHIVCDAVDFRAPTGAIAKKLCGGEHDVACLRQRHTAIARINFRQLIHTMLDQVGYAPEDPGPFAGGFPVPNARLEARSRTSYRFVDCSRTAVGTLRSAARLKGRKSGSCRKSPSVHGFHLKPSQAS